MTADREKEPFRACVYCASRPGSDPRHMEAATSLGAGLAHAGMRLVYGAGDVGLMGAVARAAQAAGGETFGVIPQHLVDREVGKRDLTAYVVTETMHERKKVMLYNSDVVVALPGGPGTLDELFEALTWRQLGLHRKPVLIVNVGGYWDPLLALIRHMTEAEFCGESFLEYFESVPTVDEAMERLEALAAAR